MRAKLLYHTISSNLCSSTYNMVGDLWGNTIEVLASVARAKEVLLAKHRHSVISKSQHRSNTLQKKKCNQKQKYIRVTVLQIHIENTIGQEIVFGEIN